MTFDQNWHEALIGKRKGEQQSSITFLTTVDRTQYQYPESLCDEAEFLRTVAQHEMIVKYDDGLYRHLRFRSPGTSVAAFEVVTWPGRLTIAGDMGCFVFSRVADMFQFFRTAKQQGALEIDPSYWAQKCEAVDKGSSGQMKEYSAAKFQAIIAAQMRENEYSDEVWRDIEQKVLSVAEDGAHEAIQAATDYEQDQVGRCFEWAWEADPYVYTYRFLWACYALVWAIRKYDTAKPAQSTTPEKVS